jgi:hypothetical protein
MPQQTSQRPLASASCGFVGLWLAGVSSVALLSLVLHFWIGAK